MKLFTKDTEYNKTIKEAWESQFVIRLQQQKGFITVYPPRAAAGFLMVFNQMRDMAFKMSLLFEVCTSCPENCDILLLINRCDQEGSKQTGAERSG